MAKTHYELMESQALRELIALTLGLGEDAEAATILNVVKQLAQEAKTAQANEEAHSPLD
jgi:hypothetical protein